MNNFSQPWSNRALALLFVGALLLFLGVRLQPVQWLQAQAEQRIVAEIEAQGLPLSFARLEWHLRSFTLHQLTIDSPALAQRVVLEKVMVAPDWFGLLGGDLAAQLHGIDSQKQLDVTAHLALLADQLQIGLLDAQLRIAPWLKGMTLPLPMAVDGDIALTGDVTVDLHSGRPVAGEMHWEGRGVTFALSGGTAEVLGDFHGKVKGTEPRWTIDIEGGEALKVQGNVALVMAHPNMNYWPLTGQFQIRAQQPAHGLFAMIPAAGEKLHLSGTLLSPRIE
ncbi:MAG: hypothetical protein HQM07_03530 [Zetaproteobacteria bacterium]|nr:hypothetical protein [Zetaproteobacteria bacterium]